MPTCSRGDIVREGEIAIYHCWSRCVQRAYLCGQDPYTGRDFSYRREWIEKLLKYQAEVFGVDLANYNVLSNHAHQIVRTRPDIVATWSDEQIACRWKMAWPKWNGNDWTREPTDEEIRELLQNEKKMALARRGLSSLSWFIARTKEPISRICNQEMGTKGHFWEQRFGSREIADENALLTCMVYVDVNQVKAGLAPSLEESRCSAISARLAAWRQREATASLDEFNKTRAGEFDLSVEQVELLLADSYLAPICTDGPLMTETTAKRADRDVPVVLPSETVAQTITNGDKRGRSEAEADSEERPSVAEQPEVSEQCRTAATPLDAINRTIYLRLFGGGRRRRASDNPILSMPFSQYREIVEWVGEQTSVALETPASVPSWLAEYLTTHGVDPDNWLQAVDQFDTWFGRVVGSTERLRELLERTGNRWIRGMRNCRATFG